MYNDFFDAAEIRVIDSDLVVKYKDGQSIKQNINELRKGATIEMLTDHINFFQLLVSENGTIATDEQVKSWNRLNNVY